MNRTPLTNRILARSPSAGWKHTRTARICYSEDGLLICPLPQHTHTADCYEQLEQQTPLCGLNEHTHTESCYDADGTLLCTLPEHTHTDSCYLPQEPAKQDFSYDDAQLHLRVTVESPQPLPEGTALAVQTVDADSTLLSASASSGAEQWIVRQIGLTQAETPVDTSEMTLTAEVLVKSAATVFRCSNRRTKICRTQMQA